MLSSDRTYIQFSCILSFSYTIARAPIDVSLERRAELIRSLDNWHFEPHKLPEHEVLYCSLVIFESLFRLDGLLDMIPVSIGAYQCILSSLSLPNPLLSLDQVRDLLFNMRHVYRHQNSYHNFEHALDVLQAIHMFLYSAGRVPPASILLEPDVRTWKPKQSVGEPALVHYLTPVDVFCLYVASIGHDVGHPGVTNSFMVSSSFLFPCQPPTHTSNQRRKMLRRLYRRFMTITLPWSSFTTPFFYTSFGVRDLAFYLIISIQRPIFENCLRRQS